MNHGSILATPHLTPHLALPSRLWIAETQRTKSSIKTADHIHSSRTHSPDGSSDELWGVNTETARDQRVD